MGPTWGPSGADKTQVGPKLAPWTMYLVTAIMPTGSSLITRATNRSLLQYVYCFHNMSLDVFSSFNSNEERAWLKTWTAVWIDTLGNDLILSWSTWGYWRNSHIHMYVTPGNMNSFQCRLTLNSTLWYLRVPITWYKRTFHVNRHNYLHRFFSWFDRTNRLYPHEHP